MPPFAASAFVLAARAPWRLPREHNSFCLGLLASSRQANVSVNVFGGKFAFLSLFVCILACGVLKDDCMIPDSCVVVEQCNVGCIWVRCE